MPTDHLERTRRLLHNAGSKPRHLPGILRALRAELDGKPLADTLVDHLSRRNTTEKAEWSRDALTLAKAAMEVLTGRPYRRGRPGLSTRNLVELGGLHVQLAVTVDEVKRSYLRRAIASRMAFAPGVTPGKVPRAPRPRLQSSRTTPPVPTMDWDMTPLRSERAARLARDVWKAGGASVPWTSFVRACGESWPHAVVKPCQSETESRATLPASLPKFLSASDAARALGIGRKAMQGHCNRGVIKARRLGNPRSRWRLEAKDVEALVSWLAVHRPAVAERVARHLRAA